MILDAIAPKKKGRTKKNGAAAPEGEARYSTVTIGGQTIPVAAGTSQGKKAKKISAAKEKITVVIDHPAAGSKIQPHHYSIRIGASAGPAQISIDGGEWLACRESAGYWWYDWHSIPQGGHKLVARIPLANGKFKKSPTTRVEVI